MSAESGSALRGRLAALALTAPLLVGALAFPGMADAAAAVQPPAGQFTVQSVNGSACRAGDTQVTPHGFTGIDVSFRALQARQGGGAATADRVAQCLVTIRAAAGGYSFGLDSVSLRGHAVLAAGALGLAGAQSWFVGQAGTGSVNRRLNGPFDGDWVQRQPVAPSSIAWMPCSTNYPLNLQVNARVLGRPAATARISLTAASYHFAWKRC
jgi:hypothetical protein